MAALGGVFMGFRSMWRGCSKVRFFAVACFFLVSGSLSGCVASPSVHWVEEAKVDWAVNKAIDGCPISHRYRVVVEEDHSVLNRTALEYKVVDAAARVASREWVKEVERNAKSMGCGRAGMAKSGLPVLSVNLKSVAVHGGGIKGIMYLAAFPYILPAYVYAGWDNEYTVTVSAELEFRHAGKVMWSADIHAQKMTETDMWDASKIVYDSQSGTLGTPLRLALESLRNKVFWHTAKMNEKMRSGA